MLLRIGCISINTQEWNVDVTLVSFFQSWQCGFEGFIGEPRLSTKVAV